MNQQQLLEHYFLTRTDQIGCFRRDLGDLSIPVNGDIRRHIKDHVEGRQRMGVFALNKDSTVKWGMIDLDAHGEATLTEAQRNTFLQASKRLDRNLELPSYIEVSKSDGFHLWKFFKKPLPANKVRQFLRNYVAYIGQRAGLPTNLVKKIEVFPKQDELDEKTPFGNYVYLPFFGGNDGIGGGVDDGRTVFVDGQRNPIEITEFQTVDQAHLDKITDFIKLEEMDKKPPNTKQQTFVYPWDVAIGNRHPIMKDLAVKLTRKGLSRTYVEGLLSVYNNSLPKQVENGKETRIINDAEIQRIVDWTFDRVRPDEHAPIPFELEDGAAFLKREAKMREYLWNEIMGSHKILCLAAPTNVGKTLLSHQVGICLSIGAKNYLGFDIPGPRRVLFLNFETSPEAFHNRHLLLCTSFPEFEGGSLENFFVNTFASERHLFQDNWDRIQATVETNPAFDFIIIDNIYACTGIDDEKNAELKPLLKRVFEIADIHQSSILLVTHHKKHSPEDILTPNLVRGGSTLTNAVDVVIQMGMSLRQPGLRLFKITKNRDRSPNLGKVFGLKFDPVDLWFSHIGLVDERSHLTHPKRSEALNILAEMDEEFETAQYVGAVENAGAGRKTAYNWLKKLEGKFIKKLEHGKYRKLIQ